MKRRISSYIFIFVYLLVYTICCSKEDLKPPEPVEDIDGNSYKTVKIGTQVWMAENLKTTRYNDGTEIPLVNNSVSWGNLTTSGYCWYNNEENTYRVLFGALYNGYTISSGKLCPSGWHVPVIEDFVQLRESLADTISGGGKLKEAGTVHWQTPNKGATNSSRFGALAAGIRYFEGFYTAAYYSTCFWSATEIGTNEKWYLSLYYGDAKANLSHISSKYGFSVRCIKD